ncbi:MAG: porin family protein, partial [Dysgonamonadaceae bacterium]|nr:porin family protein [Dysgonamonadaceae bacterium]
LRIPDDFGKISHRPPVSVGWSVRKTLTDYLSIESGITYTYLYSTFENTFPRGDASLALHYLGIPVNLVVDLLPHSRKWNFYFSAGGMGEKGLLSHAVQNTYSPGSDEIVNTNVSNQKISGIQWSVQAALGVSYPFSRTYSLFIEPKISYYLENNQPFNVRTERPFVPGVTVGIRHTW